MTGDVPQPAEAKPNAIVRKPVRLVFWSMTCSAATIALMVLLFIGGRDPRTDFAYHIWFLLFPLAFSVLATLFAAAALWFVRGSRGAPGKARRAKIALAIGIFLCWSIFGGPSSAEGKRLAKSTECRRNLGMIAQALQSYQAQFSQMPPTLQTLVDTGFSRNASYFLCPASLTRSVIDSRNVDATGDYYYAPLRNGAYADSSVPIVWDKTTHYASSYANAVFADGHVAAVAEGRWKELLAKNRELYERPPRLPVRFKNDCWLTLWRASDGR